MLSAENIQARARMACASDIPSILNRSPFRDANRDCIMEKKLRAIRDPEHTGKTTKAMERGNYLEEAVARLCLHNEYGDPRLSPVSPRALGNKDMFIYGATMRHKDLPRYGATLDFLISEDGQLRTPITPQEVKTSSSWDGWDGGHVPDHVWIQMQWQMYVLSSWTWAPWSMACGLICSNPVQRWVGYDPEFIKSILPSVDHFLADLATHEVNGTSPPPRPPEERQQITLHDTAKRTLEDLIGVRAKLADLKRVEADLTAAVLDNCPESVYGQIQAQGAYVSVCKRKASEAPSKSDVIAALRRELLSNDVPEEEINRICNTSRVREKPQDSRYLYIKLRS